MTDKISIEKLKQIIENNTRTGAPLIDKVEFLKELGLYKEESRFATVKFSDEKDVLLESENGHRLIDTWNDSKDLNNFENFENDNFGHAILYGNFLPFEIIDCNGKVLLKYDGLCYIRFLKK